MNILYCGDGNIADGLIISALSLAKVHTEPICVYVLTASIKRGSTTYFALGKETVEKVDKILKQKNEKSFARLFDITDEFNSFLPTANLETRFTPCCMLRLYADLIDELPDRLLYLDNDVICRKDLGGFYNQDLTNCELVGVLDYYGSHFFKRKGLRRDYINSGVLLLNMKRIKETKLFEKCRERCKETEMFMPDQTAINKLCREKKMANRRFNEQRKLRKDTVLQHFTTSFRFFPWFHTVSVKPWNIEGMHKTLKLFEYDDVLEKYIEIKQERMKETV